MKGIEFFDKLDLTFSLKVSEQEKNKQVARMQEKFSSLGEIRLFYIMNDYGRIELWYMEESAFKEMLKDLYPKQKATTILPYAKMIGKEKIDGFIVNPMINDKIKNPGNPAQYVAVRECAGYDQEYAHYQV